VDDRQLWHQGVLHLNALLSGLTAGTDLAFTALLDRYRQTKEKVAAVVAEIDASSVCRQCAGQCCLNGKYRINLFDALAHIAAQIPTSVNFSQKPICPYGSHSGCSMEPGFRPADCILFICDEIDMKLSPEARMILDAAELELRECILKASRLTGEQLGTPLLLWASKQKHITPKE
jgi:hypothetical protein